MPYGQDVKFFGVSLLSCKQCGHYRSILYVVHKLGYFKGLLQLLLLDPSTKIGENGENPLAGFMSNPMMELVQHCND